jgi:hypothetical protein
LQFCREIEQLTKFLAHTQFRSRSRNLFVILKIAQPLCKLKSRNLFVQQKNHATSPYHTWEDSFFIEQPEQAAPVCLREVSLRGAHDGLLVYELDEGGGAAARLCQLAQVSHLYLLRLAPG